MSQVFVYGTLKRKQINHVLLEGVGIERIRIARLRGVQLFDITDPVRPYPYPALLRGQGQLLGELVTLKAGQHPEDALLVLDHLELEGFEYKRVQCWVHVQGQLERAWVFMYASKKQLWRNQGKKCQTMQWLPRR
jgi:gamma-glutamylcyclotransferase (GGCT)/AIG2-like uncharacterized protein YtfP